MRAAVTAAVVLSLGLTAEAAGNSTTPAPTPRPPKCPKAKRAPRVCSSNSKAVQKCLATVSSKWEARGYGSEYSSDRVTYCTTMKHAKKIALLSTCCTGVSVIQCSAACEGSDKAQINKCKAALQKVCDSAAKSGSGSRRLMEGEHRMLASSSVSLCNSTSAVIDFYEGALANEFTSVAVQSFALKAPGDVDAAIAAAAAAYCTSEKKCPGLECLGASAGNFSLSESLLPKGSSIIEPCASEDKNTSALNELFASVLSGVTVIPNVITADTESVFFQLIGTVSKDVLTTLGLTETGLDFEETSLTVDVMSELQFEYGTGNEEDSMCNGGEVPDDATVLFYGGSAKSSNASAPNRCVYKAGEKLVQTFVFNSGSTIGDLVGSSLGNATSIPVFNTLSIPKFGNACIKVNLPVLL